MQARLVPLTPGSAQPVNLSRPVLLVGRHPECDVRIDLPQVSRRHCCIALAYDRLTIRDLGSRHGIRVNGRQVEEARLFAGDEIAIGHIIYRLEDNTPPPPRPPASAKPKNAPEPAPAKPPSLPEVTTDPSDPDGDLVPLSDMFPLA
jgi:predicted component of type VI protein secretion system